MENANLFVVGGPENSKRIVAHRPRGRRRHSLFRTQASMDVHGWHYAVPASIGNPSKQAAGCGGMRARPSPAAMHQRVPPRRREHVGLPRLHVACARRGPVTEIVRGRPKLWANFRALTGIFSQSVHGPSLAIWANPVQFSCAAQGAVRCARAVIRSSCIFRLSCLIPDSDS